MIGVKVFLSNNGLLKVSATKNKWNELYFRFVKL